MTGPHHRSLAGPGSGAIVETEHAPGKSTGYSDKRGHDSGPIESRERRQPPPSKGQIQQSKADEQSGHEPEPRVLGIRLTSLGDSDHAMLRLHNFAFGPHFGKSARVSPGVRANKTPSG